MSNKKNARIVLEEILNALNQKNIQKRITTPIKQAESEFKAKYPIPSSIHEFNIDCARCWNHLNITYYKESIGTKGEIVSKSDLMNSPFTFEQAYGHARDIIMRDLGRSGGIKYAFYMLAQVHTFQAIKSIITKGFLGQCVSNYTSAIFGNFFNPYDSDFKIELTMEYVKKFNIKYSSKGEFYEWASNIETLLRSHVLRENQADTDRRMGTIVN